MRHSGLHHPYSSAPSGVGSTSISTSVSTSSPTSCWVAGVSSSGTSGALAPFSRRGQGGDGHGGWVGMVMAVVSGRDVKDDEGITGHRAKIVVAQT